MNRGVQRFWAGPAGPAPPLIATRADVDEIVAGLGACLAAYQQEIAPLAAAC